MFTNRKMNLFLIGALAIALMIVLALSVAPSAAAPTIKAGASNTDYAARHPELTNPSIEKAVGSDWYQRQVALGNLTVGKAVSLSNSDWYERHPELRKSVEKEVNLSWPPRPDFSILIQKSIAGDQAGSDFYARHPELNERAAADVSDYIFRHPLNAKSTSAIDTSDYFLRHR